MSRLLRQREWGVFGLLTVTLLLVGVVNHAFLGADNLEHILVGAVPTVIVGCALTFVILLGEIDISVGSLLGLLATVLGLLTSPTHGGLPVALGVLLTLLLGGVVGLVNGLLVTLGRMPSIIVTLGTLTVLHGINLFLMNGHWITDLPPGLRFLGMGRVLGIPLSVLVAAVVAVLAALLARETPLGRRIYATGSNPDAARLAGLSTARLKLFAFTLTGLLTGVATVVSVPQLSVIEPGIGQGFELLVVTCVVVGGTSIRGGQGTIWGTVLSALLLGTVRPMLLFLRLGVTATYWERAIQGLFILLAVLADHAAQARARRQGAQL